MHVRVNVPGKMHFRWVSTFPENEGAELTDFADFYLKNGNFPEAEKIYAQKSVDFETSTIL